MPEISEDQYRKLKAEVERAKSDAERAQGALDQLMSRLEKEFECSSIKEAQKLLAELEAKEKAAKAAFQKAFTDYERKWKGE